MDAWTTNLSKVQKQFFRRNADDQSVESELTNDSTCARRKPDEPSFNITKSTNLIFCVKGSCLEIRCRASDGGSPRCSSRASCTQG